MRSILHFDDMTRPVRVADGRRLEVFDIDCIIRVLSVRGSNRVPIVELLRHHRPVVDPKKATLLW